MTAHHHPAPRRTAWLLFLLLCSCAPARTLAQGDTLTIDDLARWNRIRGEQVSADGRYVLYRLDPDEGDPTTILYTLATGAEVRFPRLDEARFTRDGRHLLGRLKPARDTVHHYQHHDRKKELKYRDSLFVLTPGGTPRIHPGVVDFRVGERWSSEYAYTTKTSLADSLARGLPEDAHRLVVRSFTTTDSFFLEGVTAFTFARDQPVVLALRAGKDSTWNDGALRLDTRQLRWQTLSQGPATYAGPALSPDGQRAAFLRRDKDNQATQPPFETYYHEAGPDSAAAVSAYGDWLPRGSRISDDYVPRFSPDGSYLFVGTTPRRPERDSNLRDDQFVDVEVWTTGDELLYTQQNVRLKDERKRTYLAAYDPARRRWTQLGSPALPETELPTESASPYVLAYTDAPYRRSSTWEGFPTAKDLVVYDLSAGGRADTVATAEVGSPEWSAGGRYLAWYNRRDTVWRVYDAADRTLRTLTDNRLGAFYDEEDDHPDYPRAYGSGGWLEDDRGLLLYDRYDIWLADPSGERPAERITDGRATRERHRVVPLDADRPSYVPSEQMLLTIFNEADRSMGFVYTPEDGKPIIGGGPYHYGNFAKARDAEALLYTRENFADFPDLRLGRPGQTTEPAPLSRANPQQANYAWGTMHPYRWTDHQGRTLNGLLVKPPGFDSTRQYPLIVNFYERSSEGLHRHRAPFPHRSTINYSYYANRGYLIFNPDVIYRPGYPGESAYDCVMSGVTNLIDEGFVDRDRIGLQGHSWGGYQAAYLATKTNLFAAIEAGAPVVNMFSAYGGIRWGSGLSRQFQYERTQSRIGGSPWQYPLRYLENSPIFTTDKISTPLLILHNDQDGAVPWYQGIEWFTALRRLNKEAWLLNYRGEPHWPVKPQNRRDFQTRMSQFFDHYLMGQPRPRWMREGVGPLEREAGVGD